jgi:hypothetical protein
MNRVFMNHPISCEGHEWRVDCTVIDDRLTITAVRGDLSQPSLLNSAIVMLAQSFGLTVTLDDESAREAILSAIRLGSPR